MTLTFPAPSLPILPAAPTTLSPDVTGVIDPVKPSYKKCYGCPYSLLLPPSPPPSLSK